MGVVMAPGAEVQDRAAEETELHADLHQDRQIAEGQRLERGDRGTDVVATAVGGREPHARLPRRGHLDHDLPHPLAERVEAEFLGFFEDGGVPGQVVPYETPDLGVLAVEHGGQCPDVDVGLYISGRGGGGGVVEGHGAWLPRREKINQG